MIEPPNAILALLLLAHVQAGVAAPQSLVDDVGGTKVFPPAREMCEACGNLLDEEDRIKCQACIEATECMACGEDVGTEEIGRNDGECDKCAATDIDEWGL